MKNYLIIPALIVSIITLGVIMSCSSTSTVSTAKSGAQLWGENCVRCHNTPSPATLSDAEWDIAVTHMRVRSGLVAEEAEKIKEFLKLSN